MVRAITILFVLLTAAVVQAHVMGVKTREKSCDQNSCRVFYGNATCAFIGKNGRNGVYLTAAHVVRNVEAVYISYRGRWIKAKVIVSENDNGDVDVEYRDMAVLETEGFIPDIRQSNISTKPLVIGEQLTIYGYPNGSPNPIVKRGRVVEINGNTLLSVTSIVGDSGGPIFNSDNEIVGVVSGNDGTPGRGMPTIFSGVKVMETCFRRAYGRLPLCMQPRKRSVVTTPVVGPAPVKSLPVEPVPDNSEQIAALEQQIASLKAEVAKLNNTKIPVWIMDADGKAVAKQTYPLGDPIKLRFKAVKQSEAE